MRSINWCGWVVSSLVVFSGCSTGTDSPAPTPGPAEGTEIAGFRSTSALDSGLRAATSFRRAGGAWIGGYTQYTSRVSDLGELSFRGHPFAPPAGRQPRHAKMFGRRAETQLPSADIRLNTVSIRRSDRELSQGAMSTREVAGDMIIQRGEVREVITNGTNGVEQLWELDAKPNGAGDLVVAVQVVGAPHVASDDDTLRFQNADGSGLSYGKATWVDGNGVRTELDTRWTGQHIEMRVPRELVEMSAYPAALDPLLMAANNTASTYAPDTAAIGTTNLAVWENYNSGFASLRFSLIADGTGLPTTSNKAVSTPTTQFEPSVAAAGSGFVAVWRDLRSGVSNIRLARISSAGAVGGEIAVASGATAQYTPDVACISSTNCLVVWNQDVSGLQAVRASIVNPSTGAATAPVTLSTECTDIDQGAASVATNGSAYFVSWEAVSQADLTSNIRGAQVSSSCSGGTAFDVTATGGDDEYSSQAAYNGTHYVVAYTAYGADEDVGAQRVSPGGGTFSSAITVAGGAGDQSQLAFNASGSTLLGAYYDSGDISAVSMSGATVGSAFALSGAGTEEDSPKVSFGSGSSFYAVWNDRVTTGTPPGSKSTWAAKGSRASTSAVATPTTDLSVASPTCDLLTTSFSPASPQTVGTAVSITGSAGCTGGATPQYEFWLNNGTGWFVAQSYGASNTFNWATGAYPGATYNVLVRTRRVGSSSAFEAQTSSTYTLTGGTGICNTLTAGTSPTSPQVAGTAVTITASATCTNGASPEYQFYLNSGVGWALVRNWGAATFNWSTAGLPSASYSFLIRSRRVGSSAAYESQTTLAYSLTGGAGVCNTISAGFSPTSPQSVGTAVTVTASSTCTNGATPVYEFYYLPPGGYWTLGRSYSATATFNWSTLGFAPGNYTVLSRARASTSSSAYEAQLSSPYTLQ